MKKDKLVDIDITKKGRWGCIAIFLLIILVGDLYTIVPTGHVGIKVRFGAVQEDYIPEGLNFKIPFIDKIEKVDCRTQRVDVHGEGASKD